MVNYDIRIYIFDPFPPLVPGWWRRRGVRPTDGRENTIMSLMRCVVCLAWRWHSACTFTSSEENRDARKWFRNGLMRSQRPSRKAAGGGTGSAHGRYGTGNRAQQAHAGGNRGDCLKLKKNENVYFVFFLTMTKVSFSLNFKTGKISLMLCSVEHAYGHFFL
jgi:hypothetical protein